MDQDGVDLPPGVEPLGPTGALTPSPLLGGAGKDRDAENQQDGGWSNGHVNARHGLASFVTIRLRRSPVKGLDQEALAARDPKAALLDEVLLDVPGGLERPR
jgi:hypothetical protein